MLASAAVAQPARGDDARLARLKAEAVETVDASQKLTQEIVDSLFSFSELAFQEVETQRYLTELLEEERLRGRDRRLRHAVVVVGDVGQRRARDRARLGHRRHSEGVAGARRRVPRAARSKGRRATAKVTTRARP